MYSVKIKDLAEEFHLTNLAPSVSLEGKILNKCEVNRPALQLTGFYEHFDNDRLQIFGMVEHSYLSRLETEQRKDVLKRLFSFPIASAVICKDLEVFPEMLEYAKKYDVPLFKTTTGTSTFMAECIRWLTEQLAERITMHGVLVDIYGEGILIIGESGIGKSETALELIKRGHRLVADDAVEIKKISHDTLVGTSPELIRYFIELRGIGIIDVKELFGVSSVKISQNIDLVIRLEMWDSEKDYDRLGLAEEYIDILGNKIVCNSIPVRPGRNVAVICESAAINQRQKRMGYNAAEMLSQRINQSFGLEED
ncbi:MAG TPA: HPr(Ser) kinase/phosphatase [Candidatus Coprocola pullicola]|nr:HPr(Ser) kinase/phosphatase [Candidatus Coprocola pullicola]